MFEMPKEALSPGLDDGELAGRYAQKREKSLAVGLRDQDRERYVSHQQLGVTWFLGCQCRAKDGKRYTALWGRELSGGARDDAEWRANRKIHKLCVRHIRPPARSEPQWQSTKVSLSFATPVCHSRIVTTLYIR